MCVHSVYTHNAKPYSSYWLFGTFRSNLSSRCGLHPGVIMIFVSLVGAYKNGNVSTYVWLEDSGKLDGVPLKICMCCL